MAEFNGLALYREALNASQRNMYDAILKLIKQAHPNVSETLFAKQPYFFLPEHEKIKFHYRPSIMMSFFGHHVNIFANKNVHYKDLLKNYTFTAKNTMQIRIDQSLDDDVLISLFKESLSMIDDLK